MKVATMTNVPISEMAEQVRSVMDIAKSCCCEGAMVSVFQVGACAVTPVADLERITGTISVRRDSLVIQYEDETERNKDMYTGFPPAIF